MSLLAIPGMLAPGPITLKPHLNRYIRLSTPPPTCVPTRKTGFSMQHFCLENLTGVGPAPSPVGLIFIVYG